MLRFFVETMPLGQLQDPALLTRVARAADGLVLAVRPGETELRATVAAVRAAGLAVTLWPMLADADGRWCTVQNVAAFVAFAQQCVQDAGIARGDGLLFDLEPPWRLLEALTHRDVGTALRVGVELVRLRRRTITRAESLLADYASSLHEAGISVQTAEFPWALASLPIGRAFGVPRLRGPAARGVMLYTSMLEGYAAGLLDRGRTLRLLERLSLRARRRLGADVEVQLGAVGQGALDNEPTYRDVTELRRDLDVARRAGARRIAVFELGGILQRQDAEAWLAACSQARNMLWEPSEASCESCFPR